VQIDAAENESDREKLRKRLAKLSGGVGVIRVGGSTESEIKERKDRVDDALHATRAAIEEGVVPGGGVALLRAQKVLEGLADGLGAGERAGVAVLLRALEEPLRRIAENAGVEAAVAVHRVRELKGSFGFNARTEEYEDLLVSGVMDATKVVRSALQNAASVATLLLTTDTAIAERD
jgi:chaperonin GroEL